MAVPIKSQLNGKIKSLIRKFPSFIFTNDIDNLEDFFVSVIQQVLEASADVVDTDSGYFIVDSDGTSTSEEFKILHDNADFSLAKPLFTVSEGSGIKSFKGADGAQVFGVDDDGKVLTKKYPVYDVELWGISASATDNKVALEALLDYINASPEGCGVVKFPTGTFKFVGELDKKNYPNIAFMGVGIDKTILDFTFGTSPGHANCIKNIGSYSVFSGFSLLGPARLSTSIGIHLGSSLNPVYNVLIEDVKLQEFDFGIVGQEGQNLIIRNVEANDCANACIGIGSWKNAIAENIFIDTAQDWGMYVSMPWDYCQNIHVRNVYIKNTHGVGFYWNGVISGSAHNIYLENCATVRDYSLSATQAIGCQLSEIYIKDSQRLAAYISGCNASSIDNIWVKDSLADSFNISAVDNVIMSGVKIEGSAGNDMTLTAPVSLIVQGLDTGSNGYSKINHPEYITFIGDDNFSPSQFPFVKGIKNYNADISNGTPSANAEGTFTFTGLPSVGETFNINGKIHTIVASLTNYNQILIGGTIAEMCDNMEQYFNLYSDESYYGRVKSESNGVDKVKFTWQVAGVIGNSKVFTETLSNCTADGGGFFGGTTLGVDEAINFIAKSDGELKIKKLSSSGGGGGNAPLPSANDMLLIWTDTDDSKIYLVINDGGVAKKTQLV